MEKFHDSGESSHPGQYETYTISIQRQFFCVHMCQDIINYMQSCFIYACTITSNQKASVSKKGMRPRRPWEVVALGLKGPYPRSSQGKTGILVITDLLTRLVSVVAIPEGIASCIRHVHQGEVFIRYDYPQCLLPDDGTKIYLGQLKRTHEDWGIEHLRRMPIYHPQANPTELRNQNLKRLLRVHLVHETRHKWDQHLHEILLSLRQCVKGFSPTELPTNASELKILLHPLQSN